MIIVSKNKDIMVNTDHVKSIFIGADGCSLKANFGNTDGCQIARYSSPDESRIAFEMIYEAIGKKEVFVMPEDYEVKSKIMNKRGYTDIHHVTGKKTKGHGGS